MSIFRADSFIQGIKAGNGGNALKQAIQRGAGENHRGRELLFPYFQTLASAPEPAAWALMVLGIGGVDRTP